MALGQILGRQSRAEIIMLAHQLKHMGAKRFAKIPVARPTTLPGNQGFSAVDAQPAKQPINLTRSNTQQRCRILDPQLSAFNPKQRIIT